MKNIQVIGSGISGLSVARMMMNSNNVEVMEASSLPGGIIKCSKEDASQALFHRVGGHVFNSKNQEVLNWFWSHFDRQTEFLSAKRNAKILLDSKYIGYPIENYLYQLPAETTKKIVSELISGESLKKDANDYENFKDFLIGNFGNTLYSLYFEPYNKKIWNQDLKKIPLPWLEGKLPMPNIKEIFLNNILKGSESEMVHSTFYYPINEGSQFIVNRLSEHLNIHTNSRLENIKFSSLGKIILNGDISNPKDLLIYTGDIRNLHNIIEVDDLELKNALENAKKLIANGTSNVLCETDNTDLSWLYLPDSNITAHRIIYTGNFSNNNNGILNRKTCVVEFSGFVPEEKINYDLSLLPGNLKALDYNYEPKSYIIQDDNTRILVSKIKKLLKKRNIYLLGRFAEWEYYNMDKCIESAMLLDSEIKLLD